ncbi:hypothetical protein TNCV_2291021 [Trichonephila clavipes]|uniref:Uncharacterized protein n=1 Tax=Trichonephila clavipes TaxID=2585209 RepID=A0A8X6RP82_TRICX|nr:hypothetical protein TNCV_2291021 [Trichonephila clavipes]
MTPIMNLKPSRERDEALEPSGLCFKNSGVTENIRAPCKLGFLGPKPKYVLFVSQALGPLKPLPLPAMRDVRYATA